MTKMLKQVVLGASMGLSICTIASCPAFAASLTNATITGSAATDYLTYDADSINTFLVPNSGAPTWANERKALTGNITNPTGNVELFASSEQLSNTAFATYTGVTSLTGQLGGQNITFSSLTLNDWNSVSGGKTLGRAWFEAALTANGLGGLLTNPLTSGLVNQAYSAFIANGGFQRFSDPNVSYVNQDDTTGQIRVGLAGHLNARDLIVPLLPAQFAGLVPSTVQASELIKYTYDGKSGYLYSFKGVASGLVEKGDGKSHTATYEITFPGTPPTTRSVPEPSVLVGLVGLAGLVANRRKTKSA